MTKEEAIEWLKSLNYCDGEETQEVAQAIEIAIKALEQQPSDCVSLGVYKQVMRERDIAIEQLRELGYEFGEKIRTSDDCVSREDALSQIKTIETKLDFVNIVKALPPVTPTQSWIPVSERLPNIKNRTEKHLVTLKDKTVSDAMFTECDGEHWWNYDYDDVIAWMPLPQPYEEKRGNEE